MDTADYLLEHKNTLPRRLGNSPRLASLGLPNSSLARRGASSNSSVPTTRRVSLALPNNYAPRLALRHWHFQTAKHFLSRPKGLNWWCWWYSRKASETRRDDGTDELEDAPR